MQIKKKYLILGLAILTLVGCQNQVFFNPFKLSHNINTLEVPPQFNWSLSITVDLELEMNLIGDSLESLEGEILYLLDTNFRILTRGIIRDNKTHLYYKVPLNLGVMYAYLPATGNFEYIYSTACLGKLSFLYGWDNPDEESFLQYLEFPFDETYFDDLKTGHGLKASVFGNSDFSENSLESVSKVRSNLNVDGTWYKTSGNKAPASIENYEGNPALKLGQQDKKKVDVFQTISWTESGEFTVTMQAICPKDKDIKVKLYLLFYDSNGKQLSQRHSNYNIKKAKGWKTLTVSGEIPNKTSFLKLNIQDQGHKETVWIDDITTNYDTDNDQDDDGIPDDEDDYPDDSERAFNDYYPGENSTGTLAFEDLWPSKGDYDFNDLIIDYRFNQVRNADNNVVEILARITLRAIGGSFHNGFGFELPVNQNLVSSVSGTQHQEGIVETRNNGTEEGADEAIIIVFEDAWNYLMNPGSSFVNTNSESDDVDPYTFDVVIQFTRGLTNQELVSPPYNPFIFTNSQRDVEIHLFGKNPTVKMNRDLLGTGDDYSTSENSQYFKTSANLPWALDIPSTFDYPEEKATIDSAYNHFIEWAETGGNSKNDWYHEKSGYRNVLKIFRQN
ncbi:MAG: LruC domain-containing protein [Bacteroidetes bacterium]|jgi:LruC domain-containing protein|nr:LruC domain-containing protein [Bacteroidota bacterium]MBT4400063.1 LruC domain-containing protein [Bacteroidota bacterium]MBT4410147.1 LruC domain-containing protein [Bacteroidota bacterium]MBT5425107.1 LruC domain-containing protein [Bacteroidota bacterium]MBT7093700.1 LruC domain-containing protein [Bacteroidota bacterium]